MRAKIMYLGSKDGDTGTLVRITDTRNREAVVKVFSDGSRLTKSGPSRLVENLFRAGRKASDKDAFRDAIQRSRESGEAVDLN